MGIGGFLLITLPVQAQKKTKEKQPNVIFIITDDLGYGDMSCYRSEEHTSELQSHA